MWSFVAFERVGPRGGDSSFAGRGRAVCRASTVCNLGPKGSRQPRRRQHKMRRFCVLPANQSTHETSWNGMIRALCAVRMPGTSQGASIQAQWTLAWSCSPSIGSDRSAQRTTYGQEARNGGQQNEILIEMQLTQFFNRSTTLSLHLLKLSNAHVTS